MFSCMGWRAYSQERGESVTRCDRRRRELEFESPLSSLVCFCESTARAGLWRWGGTEAGLRVKEKS